MTPPIGPQHSAGKLAHHNETHDELSKIHIHVHSEWQTLPERMLNKHRIQPTTRLYISLFLVVVASDNFLIITVASLPMAPKEEKTRGVNEHCLILFINSLYSLLSSLKFWNRNPSGLDIWTQGRNAFFFDTCVSKKCISALGPDASHKHVSSVIRVCVCGAGIEYSRQGLQLQFNLSIIVNFFHIHDANDICKIIMVHEYKTWQLTYLGVIHCELFTTWTVGE